MYNDSQGNNMEQNSKSFLGIFLNQARLNAYITLCHISDLLGEKTVDEDSLAKMPVLTFLDNWGDPIKSRRTYELIHEHFPMLEIIYKAIERREANNSDAKGGGVDINVRAAEYRKILQTLLIAINCKRNECCHAKSADTLAEKVVVKELVRYLEDCFDASVDEVKNRLSLYEDDHNDNSPKDECLHLRRFKGVEKVNGKGKPKANPFFQYAFKDDNGLLTDKGLAFLVSIFLDKDDTFKFLKTSDLHGFKNDTENKFRATLLSYCTWRIKLPHPKVRSDDDITGLALDMLGDIEKCPKELFRLLSTEKQKDFRVKEALDGDEYSSEILLMRYSDRFPYLALRYCDEMEVFANLRFHIDLGRYYFKFYPKKAADGIEHPRQLDKNLKTFGRIREVKDQVKEQWENNGMVKAPDEIKEGHNEPYIRKTTPHYHIVDNQICLEISSGKVVLPELEQNSGGQKTPPRAWLSVYELPGMIFHGLGYGFEHTELLIKQYIKEQREICRKICETGVIPENAGEFLPEGLKDTGTSNAKQNNYAGEKLQRMLEDTKHQITAIKTTKQRMDDKSNKPGKKKFFDIRAGKLADFLARDIIRLQPFDPAKKGKDKTTALNFQVLQETLAFFGAKKHSLERIWKELGLIGGKFEHPFLTKLGNPVACRSIVDFYQVYLDKRLEYLESLKESELKSIQFLRPSRQRYAAGKRDLKTIAERLLERPVNIPNDLFREDIEKFVQNIIPSINNDAIEIDNETGRKKLNTAYLIQEYFRCKEGNHQPVYHCEKTYQVVSKAGEYSKKARNRSIAEALLSISPQMGYKKMESFIKENIPDEGRYEPENLRDYLFKECREFKGNERTLRRFKVQDAVIFMMFKDILKKVFDCEVTGQVSTEDETEVTAVQDENNPANPARKLLELKLENIDPAKYRDKDSIFQYPMPPSTTDISITFNSNLNYEKDYVEYIDKKYKDCAGYSTHGNKREVTYRIVLKNVKLRDIGKHRRYFRDRRLPGLLSWRYMPGDEIDCAEIEEQIEAYEQHRVEIAGLLYGLENKVIDCFMPKDALGDDYIDFNRIIDTIKDKLTGVDEKAETLRKIRNGVYHNQFPVFTDAIEKADGGSIAEKMLSITKRYVEQITKEIN